MSAFHQYALGPAVRPYFASRISTPRSHGSHSYVQNTTLPMGYRNAVAICQGGLSIACLEARWRLAEESMLEEDQMENTDHEVWVDNGIFLGNSEKVIRRLLDKLREVTKELGLVWEPDGEVSQRVLWCGLDINLKDKVYAFKQAWREKVRPLFTLASCLPVCTPEIFSKLAGLACYVIYLSRQPMLRISRVLQSLSRLCASLRKIPETAVEVDLLPLQSEFRRLLEDLDKSWPLMPADLPSKVVVGFTDASDWHYGLVSSEEEAEISDYYHCH